MYSFEYRVSININRLLGMLMIWQENMSNDSEYVMQLAFGGFIVRSKNRSIEKAVVALVYNY